VNENPATAVTAEKADSVVARTEDILQTVCKGFDVIQPQGDFAMFHPDGYGYNNNTGQYGYHWNGYDANGNPHSGAR
jgi:hypothetical protein